MQQVIAGLERFTSTFEQDVALGSCLSRARTLELDPGGGPAVCNFFAKGLCEKCRPPSSTVVCKHERVSEKVVVCQPWLQGLCQEGNHRRFLPQFHVSRMPKCHFYFKF
ncbi:Putative cleavage and polyadenylation specificity factor subunit 4-like protein, partial [Heterocephalus glaber]